MRACARSKDVGFSCRSVLRHDHFCANPTGGFDPLLTPHRPKARALSSCLFPAWITHLPTPQGCGQPCGFVSYPRSKLTPSVCKTHSVSHTPVASACGAFFKKDQGNGIGDRGQSLPASVAHPRWTTHSAPSHWPTGSRGPCARAHRGRSPRGPGGSMPHARSRPRRRRDAGGRPQSGPFARPPWGGLDMHHRASEHAPPCMGSHPVLIQL